MNKTPLKLVKDIGTYQHGVSEDYFRFEDIKAKKNKLIGLDLFCPQAFNLTHPYTYNDWYLPARNQVVKILTEIHDEGLGSFSGKLMCSTTIKFLLLVETFYYWNFNSSVWVTNGDKSTNYKVRPVRDFESTEVYALRDVVGGGWIYDIEDLGGGNFKYYVVADIDLETTTTFGTAGVDTFVVDSNDGKQNTIDILTIDPTAPAFLYCSSLSSTFNETLTTNQITCELALTTNNKDVNLFNSLINLSKKSDLVIIDKEENHKFNINQIMDTSDTIQGYIKLNTYNIFSRIGQVYPDLDFKLILTFENN